jgi:hypothetical protein
MDKSHYEAMFIEWRSSLQAELDKGKSWVRGNEDLLKYLGKNADSHTGFLLAHLRNDFFTVLVLDASNLAKDRREELKNVGALQDRQRIWLNILSGTSK